MNTFCVLPWYGLELPSGSPCCLLPKNTNIDQLKSDILSGVASPACNKCWIVEGVNQTSRRQFENSFLDYKLDQDITSIQNDCKIKKIDPVMYQITTSNLCNQACVSCSSGASSKWTEIEKKMGFQPRPLRVIELSDTIINYSTAERVSLLGGEPLFDPRTFEILQQLIYHKNTNCFISLVTNGSIELKQTHLDILTKFTDLNICVSIDGVGPVFEYLRWPAKWSTLLKNLEIYKTITKNISISYTISSLNLFYHEQTTKWFKQQNLRYNHNIVTNPTWLSVSATPKELKQVLNNNSFAMSLINTCDNQIDIKEYASKLLAQDHAKRIHINDYLPEIWDVLKDSAR